MNSISNDEESFVVLGTSPTPSMDELDSIKEKCPKEINPNMMEMSCQTDASFHSVLTVKTDGEKIGSSTESSVKEQESSLTQSATQEPINGFSLIANKVSSIGEKSKEISVFSQTTTDEPFSLLQNEVTDLIKSAVAENIGLANDNDDLPLFDSKIKDIFDPKFVLGCSLSNSVKLNVLEEFPSFQHTDANAQDIKKLQNLISEHLDLKDNLQKTNFAMRQHFATINKWHEAVRARRDVQEVQLLEQNKTIEKLQEEISKLKNELEIQQKRPELKDNANEELRQLQCVIMERETMIKQLEFEIESTKKNPFDIGEYSLSAEKKINSLNAMPVDEFEKRINQLKVDIEMLLPKFPEMSNDGDLQPTQATSADIQKLKALIREHLDMKENLQKTNLAMRQHYGTINKWYDVCKFRRTEQENKFMEQLQTVEKLQHEIAELKQELQVKTETIETNEKMAMELKHKNDQSIVQHENLILELHSPLETLKRNANDGAAGHIAMMVEKKTVSSTISSEEYEILIKQLKDELSKLLAENLEMQDMKKTYVDELNCYRVNLTAAEELHKETNSKAALFEVKTADMEKLVTEKNKTIIELRNEIKLAKDLEKKEMQKLLAKLSESEKCSSIMKSDLFDAQQNRIELQKSFDELQQMVSNVSCENDLLKEQKVLFVEELKKLQHNLAEASDANKKMTAELIQLTDEKQSNERLLKERESQIYKLQSNVKLMEAEKMVSFQKELTDTQRKFDEARSSLERMGKHKTELSKLLEETTIISAALKDENTLLQEQLEVYKNDFEYERKARLEITNEREEILSDLKLLQRRNEQLMKEKEQRPVLVTANSSSSSSSTNSPNTSAQMYSCPICRQSYGNLSVLETHIQICLEN